MLNDTLNQEIIFRWVTSLNQETIPDSHTIASPAGHVKRLFWLQWIVTIVMIRTLQIPTIFLSVLVRRDREREGERERER